MTSRDRDTIDFGFQSVPREEKARRVRDVFDSVADRYDLMNDLMSFGIHRLWKRFTLARTGLRPGGDALDLAGGTGDLSLGLAKQAGPRGRVVLSDINGRMLARGRDRLVDEGVGGRIACAAIDAERLPFPDRSFDCVTIGFGLRNVTDKDAALGEMHRVLKPGGRALVLEFSKPVAPGLGPVYDAYSFQVLPRLGRVVTGDSDSYRYLAESIRMHPDQEKLAGMMGRAGFEDVDWHNLTGGVVALHVGFRY